MKTMIWWASLVVAMASGCAVNGELKSAGCIDNRPAAVNGGGAIARDQSELRIVSSLKTHKPGAHSFDLDSHGTADYKLLVEIDGKPVEVAGLLSPECIEERALRDPEAGEGVRYRFDKRVLLKAGSHRIVVAIPEDEVRLAADLVLEPGSRNTLVLDPAYATLAGTPRRSMTEPTSFKGGVRTLRLRLNEQELSTRQL